MPTRQSTGQSTVVACPDDWSTIASIKSLGFEPKQIKR